MKPHFGPVRGWRISSRTSSESTTIPATFGRSWMISAGVANAPWAERASGMRADPPLGARALACH